MKVFICQTPFQLFYSIEIIKFFHNEEKVVIIHSDLDISKYLIHSFIFFENSKIEGGTIIQSVHNYRNILKLINVLNKTNSEISFFIPHRGGLLSNYIYYNKRFKKINFYYEGILYFYSFKESFNKHHIKRTLLSLLLGFRYKYNKVIFPSNSNRIERIYTPIKELTIGNTCCMTEVKLQQSYPEVNLKNTHLILGGPVSYLSVLYKDAIESILKIDTNPIIYYKSHSSFLTHNLSQKDLFSDIAKEYGINFTELNVEQPIELILEKINITHIYSYFSSALINIKLIGYSKIKFLCYQNKSLNNDLMKVLSFFKIKVKNV